MSSRRVVLAVLFAVAIVPAYQAITQPWSRPFSTAIAAGALAVWAAALLVTRKGPAIEIPRPVLPEVTSRTAGFVFGGFAVLAFAAALLLRWQRRADFDVTGILYLMQNCLPLTIVAILLTGAVLSFLTWRKARSRRP